MFDKSKLDYLDGFMAALSISDGEINEYSSRVFSLSCNNSKLLASIASYFEPHMKLKHKTRSVIEDQVMKYFELNLRKNLFRTYPKKSEDRKKYVSFKIMDLIDFLGTDDVLINNITLNIMVFFTSDNSQRFDVLVLSYDDEHLVFMFSTRQK